MSFATWMNLEVVIQRGSEGQKENYHMTFFIYEILNDCKKLTELTDIEKELMVGGLQLGKRDKFLGV